MEQVAAEAGLAKRTVFDLYADKPSLFHAALQRSVDTAERGRLVVARPDLAAEHFAFLVMGADMDRGMLGEPPPPADRIRERATAGADVFWRSHRP